MLFLNVIRFLLLFSKCFNYDFIMFLSIKETSIYDNGDDDDLHNVNNILNILCMHWI